MSAGAEQLGPGYGPPTPVWIFQWEAEFTELLELYRQRKPRRVLEVGTYHGGTLYHWLRNAASGTTVVSVDSYAAGVDNRALYQDWQPKGVALTVICGDSRDEKTLSTVRALGPFDWIFIDAGHFEHEVRADWENYRPLAATGGVIAFHDILPASTYHPEIQVETVWREIKRGGYVTQEIVADRSAAWGGIGVALIP